MRLLALMLALPCGATAIEGASGTSTTPIEIETQESEAPPVAELNALEAECRGSIDASTFQEAAGALTRVRESIGRICSIELVGDSPLQWRVSCGADDFFASGSHEFASPTACDGGNNAFECLGAGLRSMLSHVEHIDVAGLGHVDLELPQRGIDCPELRSGWAEQPWSRRGRGGDEANGHLAWCRAARAVRSVATGLGEEPKLRLGAVGASSSWLAERMTPGPESQCPVPTSDEDDPEQGDCQAARRVDLLVRLQARAASASSACSRDNSTPAGALFCLEECMARPAWAREGGASLGNPEAIFGGASESSAAHWHEAQSQGAPGISGRRLWRRVTTP